MTTDEILIRRFLDKSFNPKLDSSGIIFIDISTGRGMYSNDVLLMLYKIFVIDTKDTIRSILDRWCEEKVRPLVAELNDHLNTWYVKLGNRAWDVYNKERVKVDCFEFIKVFQDKYGKEFLTHFYGEWYTKMVYIESERIMNL